MLKWYISLKHPDGRKYKQSTRAYDRIEAELIFRSLLAIRTKVAEGFLIVSIWALKAPTAKQKLAQKYGFIVGSIKSAKVQFGQAKINLHYSANSVEKLEKAMNLVQMQFAKLERDIRDLFKLAGLKVK